MTLQAAAKPGEASFIVALQDSDTNDPMIDQVSLYDWLRLVRAEYEELPDLRLTPAEVEQLWGLDAPTAEAVLSALVSAGAIRKTRHGAYVRASCG